MAHAATPAKPHDLVLRCYARRSGRRPDRWVAHCVDFDLWAVGDSIDEVRCGLEDAIDGYLETVLDTDDRESIPRLLRRRAPLRFVALYHLIVLASKLFGAGGKPPLDSQPYMEPVPFQLARA